MGLSNAERQARWREQRAAELMALRNGGGREKARVDVTHGWKPRMTC